MQHLSIYCSPSCVIFYIAGRILPRLTAAQVTRRLLAERGVFGLYRGMSATAARDVGFAMLYFPLYAGLRDIYTLADKDHVPPFW